MSRIGHLGAVAFWKKYRVVPVSIAGWAIVSRETGEVVSLTNYYRR